MVQESSGKGDPLGQNVNKKDKSKYNQTSVRTARGRILLFYRANCVKCILDHRYI